MVEMQQAFEIVMRESQKMSSSLTVEVELKDVKVGMVLAEDIQAAEDFP